MSPLRRWLLEPQGPADDVVGGIVYGLLILLVFRFAFDESWAFAAASGVVIGAATALLGARMRRRRRERRASA